MHPLRRAALLVCLPPALACTPAPRGGTTPAEPATTASTEAAAAVATPPALDFSRIFFADLGEDPWRMEHGVSLPQPVREQLGGDDYDGVTRKLDAAAHGITSPFGEGDAVALVTDHGTIDSRVTGLGAALGGGNDWILAIVEPVASKSPEPSGGALAVLGPHPQRDARLVVLPSVPHGPRVGPTIEAARGELSGLTTELASDLASEYGLDEEDDPEAREEIAATIARIAVRPDCATAFAPKLPPGFDQLLVVDCSDYGKGIPEDAVVIPVPDPAVSGLVVLGERSQTLEGWSLHRWSTTLRAVVDLDGDGIDELWVDTVGHEWNASTLWHWDGQQYVAEDITSDAL